MKNRNYIWILSATIIVLGLVTNKVGAYGISNEHTYSLKVDSINPSDSIYYEEIGYTKDGLIGAFNEPSRKDTTNIHNAIDEEQMYPADEVSLPKFPGGLQGLMSWLSNNINYPSEAYAAKKEGRVIVEFLIKKDGSIGDVTVVNSVDSLLDAEAVRVIKAMPEWIPAKHKGKPINIRYTLPITFKI